MFDRDALVRSSAPQALPGASASSVPRARAGSGVAGSGGAGSGAAMAGGAGGQMAEGASGWGGGGEGGGAVGLQWRMVNHPRRTGALSSSEDSDDEDEDATAVNFFEKSSI